MGICIDCIYIGDDNRRTDNKPATCCKKPERKFIEDFICRNENNADLDFVTGKLTFGSCRIKNMFGECLFFDDGKEEKTFFAWKNGEDIIYVLDANPTSDTEYYLGINDDPAGKVITGTYFGWKSDDLYCFTQSETPSQYDATFTNNGTTFSIISEVGDDYIVVNDITYNRTEEIDNLKIYIDGKVYNRSEEDDVIIRVEVPSDDDPEADDSTQIDDPVAPEDPEENNP